MPRVSRFQNGGMIGKTLDFGSSVLYTAGSTNKKNSGVWNLPAVYDYLSSRAGFTTFTFTSAGVYGYLGPTKANFLSSYNTVANTWLNDTNYYDSVDGFQDWTVPITGDYTFVVEGASGGNSYSRTPVTNALIYGGKGAKLTFTYSLTQGDVLKLLVGQRGVTNLTNNRGAGGGGGTYVYNNTTSTLIAAAGGGGGAGDYYGADVSTNMNANHSGTSGYAGYYQTTYNGGNSAGAGGTNGGGGGASNYGSGGAGWSSDGTDATYSLGGHRFLAATNPGWGGGHYNKVYTNNTDTTSASGGTNGGFGGGGGSYAGAGGGGGYSGGGGGTWSYSGSGGGGGSYIISGATSTSTALGANYTSNGSITITRL